MPSDGEMWGVCRLPPPFLFKHKAGRRAAATEGAAHVVMSARGQISCPSPAYTSLPPTPISSPVSTPPQAGSGYQCSQQLAWGEAVRDLRLNVPSPITDQISAAVTIH